jgi:hypothetical protein
MPDDVKEGSFHYCARSCACKDRTLYVYGITHPVPRFYAFSVNTTNEHLVKLMLGIMWLSRLEMMVRRLATILMWRLLQGVT